MKHKNDGKDATKAEIEYHDSQHERFYAHLYQHQTLSFVLANRVSMTNRANGFFFCSQNEAETAER